MENGTIKAAIIGAGKIAGMCEGDPLREAPCTHAGAYLTHPKTELVAIFDSNQDRVSAFIKKFPNVSSASSINDLLENHQPDIVSVCVPYQHHCEVVLNLAKHKHRPKIIFCEKPISNSLEDAKKMFNVCLENNILLFVNNRRLGSTYKKMKEILVDQKVLSITAYSTSGIFAVGVHLLDLMIYFGGPVKNCKGFRETVEVEYLPFSNNFNKYDPRACGVMEFESGIRGLFFSTAQAHFSFFEMEVLTDNFQLRLSDLGSKLFIRRKNTHGTSSLSYGLGETEEIICPNTSLFLENLNSILTQKESSPLFAIHGLETQKLLYEMVGLK